MGTLVRLDGVAGQLTDALASPIRRVEPFLDATESIGDSATLARLSSTHGYLYLQNLAPKETVNLLRAQVLDIFGAIADGSTMTLPALSPSRIRMRPAERRATS